MLNLAIAPLCRAWHATRDVCADTLADCIGHAARGSDIDAGAVRLSLALLDFGIAPRGQHILRTGAHEGKRVEATAHRLAAWLAERHGAAIELDGIASGADAPAALIGQRGIVAFLPHRATPGGHISVLDGHNLGDVVNSTRGFETGRILLWTLT